jgi:hypothetical protein
MALTIAKQAAGSFAYSAVAGWVAVAANADVLSDEIDIHAISGDQIFEFQAEWMPVATTTPTKGCRIAIQSNLADSGASDAWHTRWEVVTGLTPAVAFALDGVHSAGDSTIAESATTGLVASGFVGFAHATLASSEIGRLALVTANTSFVLVSPLQNAHASAEAYYSQAEKFAPAVLNLGTAGRIRCLFENNYQGGTAVVGRGRILYRELRVTS